MMRIAVTTPKVLEQLQEREEDLPYRDRTKPFNFVLTPILDRLADGFPSGVEPDQFTLIAPFTKDSSQWLKRLWINIYDGKVYRLAPNDRRLPHEAAVKTYGDIVKEYRWHREAKSLDQMAILATSTRLDCCSGPPLPQISFASLARKLIASGNTGNISAFLNRQGRNIATAKLSNSLQTQRSRPNSPQ